MKQRFIRIRTSMKINIQNAAAACLLLLASVACVTNPYTGRKQFNMLDSETEAQMGLQGFQQVLSTEKVLQTGANAQMVLRVAQRIAAAADEDARQRGEPLNYKWDVVLIDSPQVNAWCMPGGKMGVYTGILPVTQSEAGLAVVMGHEVAHAIARHGGERVSQQMGVEVALQAVQIGISKTSTATQQTIMTALGAGSQYGVLLPFSRSHESEADYIGLLLMAKAGYDPREGPKLWERMGALAAGQEPPEFTSTHPSAATRISQMNEWMPEAIGFYNPDALKKPTVPFGGTPSQQKPAVDAPPVPKAKTGTATGSLQNKKTQKK